MDRNSQRYLATNVILLLTLFSSVVHQETVNQTSTENPGFNDTVTDAVPGHSIGNISTVAVDDEELYITTTVGGNMEITTSELERYNSTDAGLTFENFSIEPPVIIGEIHIFMEDVQPAGTVIRHHPVDDGPQNYTLLTQISMCGAFCNGTEVVSTQEPCLGITCRQCFCDSQCVNYGDCCPGVDGTVPEMDLDVNVEFSCVEVSDEGTAFYMVNSCPDNSTELDVSKVEIVRPVTSLRTNNTYMNSFYALCNHESKFITWASITTCRENTNTTNVGEILCHTRFTGSPFESAHRNCTIHLVTATESVIDRCNVSGDAASYDRVLEELCRSPEYRIQKNHEVFRNAFCYLCNLQPITTACLIRYVNPPNRDHEVVISDLTDIFQSDIRVECKDKQWRDPISDSCIDLHCMDGRRLEGYNCTVNDVSVADVQYSLKLQLSLALGPGVYTWTEIVPILRSNIVKFMAQFEPRLYEFEINLLTENFTDTETEIKKTRDRFEVYLTVLLRSMTNMSRYVYEDYVLSRIRGEWKFTYNNVNLAVQLKPYNSTLYTPVYKSFTYDPLNKTCCSDVYYMTWASILSSRDNSFKSQPEIYIALSSEYSCAYLEFKKYRKLENGSVMILQNNVTLQKNDYLLKLDWSYTNFRVRVCLSKFISIIKETVDLQLINGKHNTAKYERFILVYLTYTCVCLSLISIFLTFITFLMFSTLRTLPSKNTMFLASSIFAAQALFQFGGGASENRVVCRMIGMLIHFLWLSVVFWMSACCYHMFRVFAKASKAKMTSPCHWKTLLKYSLYVYGMSSLIVGSSIAANYIKSGGMTIGYGERKLCYISDPLVIALAFVLPLGVTIVGNTILFSISMYTISKIGKVEKTSSSDRGHLMVYIKLSTLTGGFWLLAILAEVTNVFALHIVSQILNGGQGVFIFLSYVTNRRVYRLWAKAFGKKDLKYRSSESSARTQSSKF